MVDRVDCGRRDPVDGFMNKSGGYTGSTGTGALGILARVRQGLGGTGGPSCGQGGWRVWPWFRAVAMSSRLNAVFLRRSRRMEKRPRMRTVRVTKGEVTAMAMVAGLMRVN